MAPVFPQGIGGFQAVLLRPKGGFLAVEIVLGVPHEVDANGHHVEGYFAQLDFLLEMDRKHYEDGFLKGRRAKMPDKPTNGRKPSKKDFNARVPFIQYTPASTDWEWSCCDTERFCERNHEELVFAVDGDWHGIVDTDMVTESLREVAIPQSWTPYPNAMLPEERERVLAIVDAKSGKHDYPDHDLQLGLQIPLVKAAFPHLDFTNLRVYNWHPSDFRESSMSEKVKDGNDAEFGYNLIDKTGRMNQRWLESTLATWREFYVEPLPIKAIYQGSPNIDTPPSENIRFADYPTYWEEKVARAIHHKFADL